MTQSVPVFEHKDRTCQGGISHGILVTCGEYVEYPALREALLALRKDYGAALDAIFVESRRAWASLSPRTATALKEHKAARHAKTEALEQEYRTRFFQLHQAAGIPLIDHLENILASKTGIAEYHDESSHKYGGVTQRILKQATVHVNEENGTLSCDLHVSLDGVSSLAEILEMLYLYHLSEFSWSALLPKSEAAEASV